MDKFERIADGEALADLKNQPGFFALLRILKKKREDIFREWAEDKDLSKDFCRGVLYVVEGFEGDIDAEIANGQQLKSEKEEAFRIAKGRALEGGGTGDLA